MSVDYLDLADFLAISEIILRWPTQDIVFVSRLGLAEAALRAPATSFGGVEFYPDLVDKAAMLRTRIVESRPFPDGNRRGGFRATS